MTIARQRYTLQVEWYTSHRHIHVSLIEKSRHIDQSVFHSRLILFYSATATLLTESSFIDANLRALRDGFRIIVLNRQYIKK